MDPTTVRRAAAVMAGIAVSLFVASAVHLLGFDADDAGVAEALIGVVLMAASAVMVRGPARARAVGLAGTGFAIAGFGVGLTVTAERGTWPEVAYHVAALPILVAVFIVLLRSGRTRDARRAPAAG